tara:strand:- start:391 stop:735 length:345 start_codon:yes stop_codon:yes gene_type:complete
MLILDSQSATMHRPSSYSIEKWIDKDGHEHVQEIEYMRCHHCQVHFERKRGSGIFHERGWCARCQGYLCGHPLCMKECLNFELRLDYSDGIREAAVSKYIDVIRELEQQGYVIE